MPIEKPRRQLKMEPVMADENLLEQLVSSVQRIEAGLSDVRDLVVRIDERERERTGGR
jgi:hypothetical protein